MNSRACLILLLSCLAASVGGYYGGVRVEGARRAASVAEVERRLEEERGFRALEDQARAEAVAEAEQRARLRLASEAARTAALAEELAAARSRLAAERQSFNRRMELVSENALASCAGLPADWVRLYNEALGLAPAGNGEGGLAAGTSPSSRSTRAAGSGVRPDVLTRPEDLIAHASDYGGYCRSLRVQLEALVAVERGKP